MAQGKHYKKKPKKKYIIRRAVALLLMVALLVGVGFGIKACMSAGLGGASSGGTESTGSQSSSKDNGGEPYIVASASVGSSGDVMCHSTQLNAAKQSDGSYYFDDWFSSIKPYFEQYDLMVANLEVTFGGAGAGAYTGYPVFNTPDSLAASIKKAGIDTVLFANNHTYDTGEAGLNRTMQVLKDNKIDFIGTRQTQTDAFWQIKDVNGIKIGMINYTYSTVSSSGQKALNGNVMTLAAGQLVNTFTYGNLDAFYEDAKTAISEMKAQGADVTLMYIHWGNEYQREPNSYQTKMAQEICDMGYDVILGSHPHVIQPFAKLTGESGNETVCIYSMGNLVSNQRAELMDSDNYSGHTEDAMIFSLRWDKYSDDTIKLADVNIQPLWVDMNSASGKKIYRITALDTSAEDWSRLGVVNLSKAKKSYNRTMKLVGEPLNAYRAEKGWEPVKLTVE